MKHSKRVSRYLLSVCLVLSTCLAGVGAAEANAYPYPVTIHVMSIEERTAFETQTQYVPMVGAAYLSQNTAGGNNGSIAASFSADKSNMVFVATSAPGASDYTIQLYAGKVGEGERVSNYTTVGVNNGVYFTGLTVGQTYYLKLSSNTLVTSGCTAMYSMFTY